MSTFFGPNPRSGGFHLDKERRTKVCKLIESPANRKPQAVQCDMIWEFRVANSSEQNCIVTGQHVQCIGGHHPVMLEIVFAALIVISGVKRGFGM